MAWKQPEGRPTSLRAMKDTLTSSIPSQYSASVSRAVPSSQPPAQQQSQLLLDVLSRALSFGAIHDWIAAESVSGPVLPSLGALIGVAGSVMATKGGLGRILWIGRRCWPYPPSLDDWVLDRSVFIDPPRRTIASGPSTSAFALRRSRLSSPKPVACSYRLSTHAIAVHGHMQHVSCGININRAVSSTRSWGLRVALRGTEPVRDHAAAHSEPDHTYN